MTPWSARAREEATLLNPAFCSALVHDAARGYVSVRQPGMPYAVAFLVLPLLLHRETRDAFPRDTRTSFAVWIEQSPNVRVEIGPRAKALVPCTREAILFGVLHGLLFNEAAFLLPANKLRKRTAFLRDRATEEVRSCIVRADFVGKWLARAGNAATVFALMGVRP